jgi:Double zinc ribbon
MVTCPSCGQENPAGFRLCGMCGAPLQEAPRAREERKVVTVLFCDLVGSTARAEQLDPEDCERYCPATTSACAPSSSASAAPSRNSSVMP